MNFTPAWNLATATLSAVSAAGSWFAATRSLKSSREAATATAGLTAIERERQHAELAPEFKITLTEGWQGIPYNGQLDVGLVGPVGLDYLDEVTIRILDEAGVDHWGRGLPTGVGEAEAARFIWGPWQFNVGASEDVSDNRTTKPRPYSRVNGKNWNRFSLVHTTPGHWMGAMDAERWQKEQPGPLRLSITCCRHPYEPWIVLHEIPCVGA